MTACSTCGLDHARPSWMLRDCIEAVAKEIAEIRARLEARDRGGGP